eukprot:TRINITY_DN9791_c0_g1_i2.p1 TRINITY_DN9791_c0_g1~~TRINITY_DN9791_c0_g1_i2.p1  ORF type:complete len:200 (+),score=-21.99 TRINITY_DN9791_c0_g1_i2:25-600(+)
MSNNTKQTIIPLQQTHNEHTLLQMKKISYLTQKIYNYYIIFYSRSIENHQQETANQNQQNQLQPTTTNRVQTCCIYIYIYTLACICCYIYSTCYTNFQPLAPSNVLLVSSLYKIAIKSRFQLIKQTLKISKVIIIIIIIIITSEILQSTYQIVLQQDPHNLYCFGPTYQKIYNIIQYHIIILHYVSVIQFF